MVVCATLSEAKEIVFAGLCNGLYHAIKGIVLASFSFHSRWPWSLFADIIFIITQSSNFSAMTLLGTKHYITVMRFQYNYAAVETGSITVT